MTSDLQTLKKRLTIMLAIDAVALVVAVIAAAGAFVQKIEWLQVVFVGALLAGFVAQIWFIAGFARAKKGV